MFLDFLIFGNGFGMAMPHFDGAVYWLVDTSRGRKNGRGAFYTFIGGLGAQLTSYQWTHPKAGERRVLCGREFKPFQSSRRWGRVAVSWAITPFPKDIAAANTAIEALKRDLGTYYPEVEARP